MDKLLAIVSAVDPHCAIALGEWGQRHGFKVLRCESPEGLSTEGRAVICVVGVDGGRESCLLRVRSVRKILPMCPIVVVGRAIGVETTVALIRNGVADVIELPASPATIVARAESHSIGSSSVPDPRDLLGHTPAIRRLREDIAAVAATDSTVFVSGETGTGKGVVARLIHDQSRRRGRPFVHVDCAALPSSLIESELFGHERGAFTGALNRRAGRFSEADRGTVFLDEVGELEPQIQAKFLRVLQDRCFERVGSSSTLRMNARVIAATNRSLRDEVEAGRFRADLYFRLSVFELHVPPLRERMADLPSLVQFGLARLSRQLGVEVPEVHESFHGALARKVWRGNVRELFNLLERLLIVARGEVFDARILRGVDPALGETVDALGADCSVSGFIGCGGANGADERASIEDTLRVTGGNIARAARRLQMPRSTLRYRIKRYDLGTLIPHD